MPPMVGGAALGVVALRAVVADELAPLQPPEQPDEERA